MNKKIETKNIDASDLQTKFNMLEKALDAGWQGLILDVIPTTSKEFFGKDSIYDDRNGIDVSIKLESPNGETFNQFFSYPDDVRGLKQCNLYAFKLKYGIVPTKGKLVDVVLNDDGFFKIVF